MKASEKAMDIYDKMYWSTDPWGLGGMSPITAKKCALAAVDEVLTIFEGLHKPEYCAFDAIGCRKFTFEGEYDNQMTGYDMVEYWNEVKQALEAL